MRLDESNAMTPIQSNISFDRTAGETVRDRGTDHPGPHQFYLLGGTKGDPVFLKLDPFE